MFIRSFEGIDSDSFNGFPRKTAVLPDEKTGRNDGFKPQRIIKRFLIQPQSLVIRIVCVTFASDNSVKHK